LRNLPLPTPLPHLPPRFAAAAWREGMMVAMGHGLCVSFWVSGKMTKNKVGPKKLQCALPGAYRKAISEGNPR
jgi:hypothetical protein